MKKWFAYTLYIVVVLLFFLYYLFPSEVFTTYINHQIKGKLPGYKLVINQANPSFPPGLKIDSLQLFHQDIGVVSAEHLRIRPAYLSLLSADKTFFIKGLAYDGSLEGQTDLSFNSKPKMNLNLNFQGIQIDQIKSLKQFSSYEISGIAKGNVVYNNIEIATGTGHSEITISDSSINFKPSLFGIDQLSFKAIETEFELNDRLILLKRLEINSRQLAGDATGSIQLKYPMSKSRINISGKIKPHPTLIKELGSLFSKKLKSGGIPFKVSGTIERPDFSLK